MSATPTAEILERLCTLLRHDARQRALPHGLRPVQVEALLYLDRCNRYSDTPQAVAEYLGSTKGTVSQTLKILEREGLLRKEPDPEDGRVIRLRLTASGRDLAQELAVPPILEKALAAEGLAAQRLADDLRHLLAAMQRAAGRQTFGTCHSCRHFRRDDGSFRCGLTGEALSTADSRKICREHAPGAAA